MTERNKALDFMEQYAESNIGTVMFEYSQWILYEAQKRGFKKIYFLARDGYLLQKIADRICKAAGLSIECRYLYCSRNSLRVPSYYLIGDEALELLTLYGYHVTPDSVISRAWLSDDEKDRVLKEIGVGEDRRFCHLGKAEFYDFKTKLCACDTFKKLVADASAKEYDSTINYLKQEGLLDDTNVVIADSGWTGSMQRSLRQLLDSCGFQGKIYGFYFGMYTHSKSPDDGQYLTYYFDRNSGTKRKVMFNNNLFECMLSAPHPMTVRYKSEGETTVPVFEECNGAENYELINAQINGALKYTETRLSAGYDLSAFSYSKSVKNCYKIIKKTMVYPSPCEAEMYGSFAFCDDVTEGYHNSLAAPEQIAKLKNYMVLTRIMNKILKKANTSELLYWPYGVIALCPAKVQPWYRANVLAWEWLKAILKK